MATPPVTSPVQQQGPSVPAIDYDALAAQHGGTAQVDYDALAAQHGGAATTSNQPNQGPLSAEELHSMEESSLPDEAKFVLGAVKGGAQAVKRFWNGANLPSGAYPGMTMPTRPADITPHGGMETAGSIIGPLATPAGSEDAIARAQKLADMVPTTGKAAKLFDEVMSAAKDTPVNLTRSQAPIDRVAQLTDAGGPTLGAPNKLMLRSQTVNPIPYSEARDFYSNISNLSTQDKLSLNGPMKKAVGELANAFKQDIGDAATSAGKGEQYYKAMQQYRQAKQIQGALKTTAKVGGAAALGGTAIYPALKYLQDLFK